MFVSKEVENLTNKGKGRKNGKSQEEERRRRKKKQSFYFQVSYWLLLRWPKQLIDRRGLFGGDIFENPARYNDACIKNIMIVVTS